MESDGPLTDPKDSIEYERIESLDDIFSLASSFTPIEPDDSTDLSSLADPTGTGSLLDPIDPAGTGTSLDRVDSGSGGAFIDLAEPVSGTVACVGDLGEGCDAYGTPKTKNGYLDETGSW